MFAHIAGPLEEMKAIARFKDMNWTPGRHKAWADVKALVSNSLVLSAPDWDEPFFVQQSWGSTIPEVRQGGQIHCLCLKGVQ
jgi:hypothetical protein